MVNKMTEEEYYEMAERSSKATSVSMVAAMKELCEHFKSDHSEVFRVFLTKYGATMIELSDTDWKKDAMHSVLSEHGLVEDD